MRTLSITLLLFTYILANAQGADRGMKAATTPTQDVRVALVIGNGAYADSPLRNPTNDATAMAAELRACGFDVTLLTNANQQQMETAAATFGNKIRNNQGVGLFYYAGHGMQVQGENYLIPVGANITVEGDVKYKAMNVGQLLAQMEAAQNRMNIVVLDACRNNPYARSFRSAAQGLAQTNAPTGSFVAYATAPGSVAADGDGSNGLYTQELLKAIRTPGLGLEQVFKQVRANVLQTSARKQVPWENSSIVGDFYFRGGSSATAGTAPTAAPTAAEIQAWARKGNELDKEENYTEAIVWYRKAADQGYANAQLNLGIMYTNGQGVAQDYAQAVTWYRKAADQGNAKAQINLGNMYKNGKGVTQDYIQAEAWYTKAADQGNAKAQFYLGEIYSYGQGVPEDFAKAVVWYRKAADQGNIDAQKRLGWIYEFGKGGVPQDYAQAMAWYRKSAEQGDASAQDDLGFRYQNQDGVARDYAQAMVWYRKAADQGRASAQRALGGMYYNGEGVPKDYAQALAWYRKAADKGNKYAQTALGGMYYNGKGVAQDFAQALVWYRKAAEQKYGEPEAENNLGTMYLNGNGVPQDYAQALAWYRKAADKGNADAQHALGWMYENGKGVSQDKTEAILWYRKAVANDSQRGQDELNRLGVK